MRDASPTGLAFFVASYSAGTAVLTQTGETFAARAQSAGHDVSATVETHDVGDF